MSNQQVVSVFLTGSLHPFHAYNTWDEHMAELRPLIAGQRVFEDHGRGA